MDEPLDEAYLRWLYSQVGSVKARKKSNTYWNLLRQLYKTEFIWFVPNDDNRVADGVLLRNVFLQETDVEADDNWMGLGCSFLEMLVALSRRLEFEGGGKAAVWFWKLLGHISLETLSDATNFDPDEVSEKVNQVIWRTYRDNGDGGLFPLRYPDANQREVEIWYQLNAYLLERGR